MPDCLICGAGPFVKVSQHAAMKHGVRAREYRRLFPGAPMIEPEHAHAWRLELLEKFGRLGTTPQRYCKYGHPLRGANVIYGTNPARRCRKCYQAMQRRRRLRQGAIPRDSTTCGECGRSFTPGKRGRVAPRCPDCTHARNMERQRARRVGRASPKTLP